VTLKTPDRPTPARRPVDGDAIEQVKKDQAGFFKQPFGTSVQADQRRLLQSARLSGYAAQLQSPRRAEYQDLNVRSFRGNPPRWLLCATAIDVAFQLPADAAKTLRDAGFRWCRPGSGTLSYLMDPNDVDQRLRVRQALNMAVDRTAILGQVMSNFGKLDAQLIGDEVLASVRYSAVRVRRGQGQGAAQQAGFGNGFEAR